MLPASTATADEEEDLAMLLQTTAQDRIIEVVRRVGGTTAASLTGIDMTSTGEPNRLCDALAAVLPARVIVTGTLSAGYWLAEHPTVVPRST